MKDLLTVIAGVDNLVDYKFKITSPIEYKKNQHKKKKSCCSKNDGQKRDEESSKAKTSKP